MSASFTNQLSPRSRSPSPEPFVRSRSPIRSTRLDRSRSPIRTPVRSSSPESYRSRPIVGSRSPVRRPIVGSRSPYRERSLSPERSPLPQTSFDKYHESLGFYLDVRDYKLLFDELILDDYNMVSDITVDYRKNFTKKLVDRYDVGTDERRLASYVSDVVFKYHNELVELEVHFSKGYRLVKISAEIDSAVDIVNANPKSPHTNSTISVEIVEIDGKIVSDWSDSMDAILLDIMDNIYPPLADLYTYVNY